MNIKTITATAICGLCLSIHAMPILAAPIHASNEAPTPGNNQDAVNKLNQIEIIRTTPLPGLDVPRNEVPANVQSLTAADLERQQSLGLGAYLNENFSGVTVNMTQDNPFQPDVRYHGFSADSLIGSPQGMSVYMDGVRINESFGGVVNWSLIPKSAISTVTLVSGSNPAFGLNTLGGALSIQTKSGSQYPGTEIQAYTGSFNRRNVQAETGGTFGNFAGGNFDYFLTGNYFDGDGWRQLSPSHVRQAFGKVGWQNETTDIDLSYLWADTNLIGNGTTPQSLLAVNRHAIFTAPDQTINHVNFINLTGTHLLAEHLLVSGNAYYRKLTTRTLNGDGNDDYEDDFEDATDPTGACPGDPTCAAALLADETGINHGGKLRQRRIGAGLQLTDSQSIFGFANQAVLGLAYNRAHQGFFQYVQDAKLKANRATQPTGPQATVTNINGTNQTKSVYLTDTFSLTDWLHLIASARYNRFDENLDGQSRADGGDPFHSVTGSHSYHRLNPAFGLTLTPERWLTVYANYNEGSRAPSIVELGCANPLIPCGLPNAFADDPPLEQVVARTVQFGAHGALPGQWRKWLPGSGLEWSIDVFRTRSSNDIQFITTSALGGLGFFDNVGDTRRQGIDVGLGGSIGKLDWHLAYSFIDATYQSTFNVAGESNTSNDTNGEITVRPGDDLPLIPHHTGRLVLSYAVLPNWHVGANLIVSSGMYLRGNENNDNRAGGTTADGDAVLGSGRIGGYAVLNLHTDVEVSHNVDIFLRVDNVLDREYATSGFLSENPFNPDGTFRTDPDNWTNENAVSPAMPRALWAGVRVHW